jgi:hypothetical protein
MKCISSQKSNCQLRTRAYLWASVSVLTALMAACGGGGGGIEVPQEPEAVVQSVANAQVLEGSSGTVALQFLVTLDKPALKTVVVSFTTGSTAKSGLDSPGSAKGGACSTQGVDYASAASQISISAGQRTGIVNLEICGDTTFEPSETLKLIWSSPGSLGGSAVGTIVNDDVGGLNGTGASTLLGGLPLTGRDANPLTNSSTDGSLGFSFDKSNADCVVDKVSGLTWQRVNTVTKTFSELAAYVSSVNVAGACGFNDWAVPTVDQLLSLMDASKTTGLPLNADYLGVGSDAMRGKYWSSESRATAGASAVDAWQVDASNGAVVTFATKTDSSNVRLVRGASVSTLACNSASLRFEDFNDGTIADRTTGLMWKKCPEGFTNAACTQGSASSFNAVNQIIDRVTSVNGVGSSAGLGYSDWRVPTRNELASLVDRSCSNPAIRSSTFPGVDSLSFVTATLDADATSARVWGVNFFDGDVAPRLLAGPFRLRLVRAGQ